MLRHFRQIIIDRDNSTELKFQYEKFILLLCTILFVSCAPKYESVSTPSQILQILKMEKIHLQIMILT